MICDVHCFNEDGPTRHQLFFRQRQEVPSASTQPQLFSKSNTMHVYTSYTQEREYSHSRRQHPLILFISLIAAVFHHDSLYVLCFVPYKVVVDRAHMQHVHIYLGTIHSFTGEMTKVFILMKSYHIYYVILCYRTLRTCLLYTSPSPRDATLSRMPSSA